MARTLTPGAARSREDAPRRPYTPRSVEEAVCDLLLRLGVAAGFLGLCVAVLPVWSVAVLVAVVARWTAGRGAAVRAGAGRIAPAVIAGAAGLGWDAAGLAELRPDRLLRAQGAMWAILLDPGRVAPPTPAELTAWAGAVWPGAVVYGLAAGLTLRAAADFFQSVGGFPEETDSIRPRLSDAGELAQRPERPVPWALPNAVGRGVLSLLSAPPGGGKGWWTWGLLRAVQDGVTFFGLPALRLTHRPWWWPWGRGRPARVLWATEEGEQTLARSARRFGIAPGLVKTLRRDQVPAGLPWEELVRLVRRRAWRERCAVVIFDTVRAWCPEAEQSPEAANAIMQTVRKELTGPGLAVLFVHHDTKQGGTFGRGVSGTYALVGAVDILIELQRVSDDPADPRRRMVTSRRYEPMDITATLGGHRYMADNEGEGGGKAQTRALAPPPDRATYQSYLTSPAWLTRRAAVLERAGGRCERCGAGEPAEVHHLTYDRLGNERPEDLEAVCRPCHRRAHPRGSEAAGAARPGRGGALPAHVRGTLARLKRLGGEIETDDLLKLEKGSRNALLARLRVLEGAGLAAYRGKGVRNDPQRWRAL